MARLQVGWEKRQTWKIRQFYTYFFKWKEKVTNTVEYNYSQTGKIQYMVVTSLLDKTITEKFWSNLYT